MSSHEDMASTQASDTMQEPCHGEHCTNTPVAETTVQFEGENLRPRPRESAAGWISRTRDNRQRVDAERERERWAGNPDKAQADWLKRWGFKSSEEADGIMRLSVFERYAALQNSHKKRAADDSEDPEARNSQPPSKKQKTVRFAEEPQIRLISPRPEFGESGSDTANKVSETEQADDMRGAQKAMQGRLFRVTERAKEWLVIKAYETSPLDQDPKRITLKQMREDSPSKETFHARWSARKQFRDDARDPPLTDSERSWSVVMPSLSDSESDDEDPFDLMREGDSDMDGDWGNESPGRIVSPNPGSETEDPADRSESLGAGPSQSPSHERKAEQVVEQPRRPLLGSEDASEQVAAEETRAKRWLAAKAFELSPRNPDPSLVTVDHMREGNPSVSTFQRRWLVHKHMMDDTRDPPLTAQERNCVLRIPPLIYHPGRFEDIFDVEIESDLEDLGNSGQPEEGASEPLVQEQHVSRKRPASSIDESEDSPSQSSAKRPRIDGGLPRERPVGWLLDSLGGQRRARRWLAERALTHKSSKTLSMEQLNDDRPDIITLWTRWATQKVMEDEMEGVSQQQPEAASAQTSSSIEPGHPPDNNNVASANVSSHTNSVTDSNLESGPAVPVVAPNLDTRAESTPKPDQFEAIMKRLDDLERIVRETRAEPAGQQASSATKKKGGRGRPKKSENVQGNDGEVQSISSDDQLEVASEQNTATREGRLRPRRTGESNADAKGKGKASDEPGATILTTEEQEPRRKPGRPRKDAQATAKRTGSTSILAANSAAPSSTPDSAPKTGRRRGRPRKEELPVKSEDSTHMPAQKTRNAQKTATAAAPSTHKMRTRTQSPETIEL